MLIGIGLIASHALPRAGTRTGIVDIRHRFIPRRVTSSGYMQSRRITRPEHIIHAPTTAIATEKITAITTAPTTAITTAAITAITTDIPMRHSGRWWDFPLVSPAAIVVMATTAATMDIVATTTADIADGNFCLKQTRSLASVGVSEHFCSGRPTHNSVC